MAFAVQIIQKVRILVRDCARDEEGGEGASELTIERKRHENIKVRFISFKSNL